MLRSLKAITPSARTVSVVHFVIRVTGVTLLIINWRRTNEVS